VLRGTSAAPIISPGAVRTCTLHTPR
jgi:hypothetical protein